MKRLELDCIKKLGCGKWSKPLPGQLEAAAGCERLCGGAVLGAQCPSPGLRLRLIYEICKVYPRIILFLSSCYLQEGDIGAVPHRMRWVLGHASCCICTFFRSRISTALTVQVIPLRSVNALVCVECVRTAVLCPRPVLRGAGGGAANDSPSFQRPALNVVASAPRRN